MEILFVNPTKKVRTTINTLSSTLTERGCKITVFLPEESRDTLQKRRDVSYVFYQARYVPGVRYTIPPCSFHQTVHELATANDIVHLCSYFYFPCTAAAVIANRSNTGVVATIDSLPGINWSYGNTAVDAIGRAYTATLGRLTFSSADRVVALGEYLVDDLERYAPRENIRVIPNGIDTSEYRIERSESNSKRGDEVVELLYVGRLDPVKGVPYLIAALAKLDNERRTYRLTIVGDGTKRAEYERRCEAMGVADRVSFEGWQNDVTPYYAAADVFVLPSLSEGQPTVLLEAQASGVPVVTTDVGGARSIVAAGQAIPTRDSDALAAAITEVGAEYAREVATDARKSIVDSFSTEQMCTQYLRLYEEVLKKR